MEDVDCWALLDILVNALHPTMDRTAETPITVAAIHAKMPESASAQGETMCVNVLLNLVAKTVQMKMFVRAIPARMEPLALKKMEDTNAFVHSHTMVTCVSTLAMCVPSLVMKGIVKHQAGLQPAGFITSLHNPVNSSSIQDVAVMGTISQQDKLVSRDAWLVPAACYVIHHITLMATQRLYQLVTPVNLCKSANVKEWMLNMGKYR